MQGSTEENLSKIYDKYSGSKKETRERILRLAQSIMNALSDNPLDIVPLFKGMKELLENLVESSKTRTEIEELDENDMIIGKFIDYIETDLFMRYDPAVLYPYISELISLQIKNNTLRSKLLEKFDTSGNTQEQYVANVEKELSTLLTVFKDNVDKFINMPPEEKVSKEDGNGEIIEMANREDNREEEGILEEDNREEKVLDEDNREEEGIIDLDNNGKIVFLNNNNLDNNRSRHSNMPAQFLTDFIEEEEIEEEEGELKEEEEEDSFIEELYPIEENVESTITDENEFEREVLKKKAQLEEILRSLSNINSLSK